LGGYSIRAVGTFGAYNILAMAGLVSYAILVSTAAFVVFRGSRRWLALLTVLGLALPLIFSFSRGAWIGVTIGVLTILAFSDWKRLALLVMVCGFGVGIVSIGVVSSQQTDNSSVVAQRLTSITSLRSSPDQSVTDRYAVWGAARGMWADHPITGVGPKNFVTFRDSYVPLSFSGGSDIVDPTAGYRRVELLSPHSLYWLILAEQGLVGGIAYATLFLSLCIATVGRLRKAGDSPVEKIFGFLCLGFMASFLTDSIYSDLGGSMTVFISILLGCTIWVAAGTRADE
jgi:O-antigen ligase